MENKRYSKESFSDFEEDVVAINDAIQVTNFPRITENDRENSVSPRQQEEHYSDYHKEPMLMT